MTLFALGAFYLFLHLWRGNAYALEMHSRLQA
jgi:hypothetical protein